MNDLPIWVVYDRGDVARPARFIARKWFIGRGVYHCSAEVHLGLSLEEIRRKLPPGLARKERAASDDPQIVECWL